MARTYTNLLTHALFSTMTGLTNGRCARSLTGLHCKVLLKTSKLKAVLNESGCVYFVDGVLRSGLLRKSEYHQPHSPHLKIRRAFRALKCLRSLQITMGFKSRTSFQRTLQNQQQPPGTIC